jgi:hypothetical protein
LALIVTVPDRGEGEEMSDRAEIVKEVIESLAEASSDYERFVRLTTRVLWTHDPMIMLEVGRYPEQLGEYIQQLETKLAEARKLMANAALSLLSYEKSYGGGGGDEEVTVL